MYGRIGGLHAYNVTNSGKLPLLMHSFDAQPYQLVSESHFSSYSQAILRQVVCELLIRVSHKFSSGYLFNPNNLELEQSYSSPIEHRRGHSHRRTTVCEEDFSDVMLPQLGLGFELRYLEYSGIWSEPDTQCSAQVFKRAGCHLKRAHLVR